MSMILFFLVTLCCGALYHEFIHYWISRLITPLRKNSPLIGQWELSYQNDEGEEVTESVRLFAEFADVAYGNLQAKMLDGSTAAYRVRFEHLCNDTYSVILKPADRGIADIGLGIVTVNVEDRRAQVRTIGYNKARKSRGQDVYIREVKAIKI